MERVAEKDGRPELSRQYRHAPPIPSGQATGHRSIGALLAVALLSVALIGLSVAHSLRPATVEVAVAAFPPPPNPKSGLAYNPVKKLATTTLYNGSGQQVRQATWTYDAAGNQTGNSGYPGTSPPLTITDNQHDQTTTITDAYQHPVAMTWTGAGQIERTSAEWSNQPGGATPEYGHTTYANAALGVMSQTNGNGTTYYTRDPSGLPISERKGSTSYYYLFDGEGNVAMLVDPPGGSPVALYDPCPTGNQAGDGWALPGFADDNMFQRYGALGVGYDAGTKDLLGFGVFTDGNSNNPTQRNCDDPLDPLMCVGPTPGPCFFGAGCTLLPGIL